MLGRKVNTRSSMIYIYIFWMLPILLKATSVRDKNCKATKRTIQKLRKRRKTSNTPKAKKIQKLERPRRQNNRTRWLPNPFLSYQIRIICTSAARGQKTHSASMQARQPPPPQPQILHGGIEEPTTKQIAHQESPLPIILGRPSLTHSQRPSMKLLNIHKVVNLNLSPFHIPFFLSIWTRTRDSGSLNGVPLPTLAINVDLLQANWLKQFVLVSGLT